MSIDKPANERLNLYNRFKESLADGTADDQFLDADDLLIIHDQAVDLDDQYVQIEALMRGYRYFPDNEELASRRGFLYYDLNLDNGAKNLLKQHGSNSPIWDLLQMRLKEADEDSTGELRKMLNKLIETPDKFDDETVIQLVDAASACGFYDWLKQNEAELRKKTEYLPALLYEMFVVSEINSDLGYGIKLLEELTEIEPFNIDFWLALAQAQLSTGEYDAAITACDYALAISSDDVSALQTKANALGMLSRFDEVLELVEPFVKANPVSPLAEMKIRAIFSRETSKEKEIGEACKLLYKNCLEYPESRALIGLAIDVQLPQIDELLALHYEKSSDANRDDFYEWGRRLYITGRPKDAAMVLKVLYDADKLTFDQKGIYVSALYTGGEYRQCADMLQSTLNISPGDITPNMAVAGLLSLLHLKKKGDCKRALNKIHANLPIAMKTDWTLTATLETIGFSSFIGMLEKLLSMPGPVDLDMIDIFQLPDSYTED